MKKAISIIIFLLTALTTAGCGKTENNPAGITLDAAEEKALSDAGLSASEVTSLKAAPEETDGISVYSIEFRTDDMKYEYEIHAGTGEIYSRSRETVADSTAAPEGNQQTADNRGEGQTPAGQEEQTPNSSESPEQTPAGQPEQTPPARESAEPPAESLPVQGSVEQVTLETAKTAALTDAGLTASDVTYTKGSLDYEDGVSVYEIEFYTSTHEYEYEIHAASGTVHSRCVEPCSTETGHHGKHHRENHQDHCNDNYCGSYWCDDCHNGGIAGTDIGAESAKNIALEHAGLSVENVTFTKAELDWEDGLAVYEIEFISGLTEYEYKINASDGSILEYEID